MSAETQLKKVFLHKVLLTLSTPKKKTTFPPSAPSLPHLSSVPPSLAVHTNKAGTRLSLSIKEVDQSTGEDLMPGRGHEAAAKLADELKSNPSGPAGAAAAAGKAASNPLHPGLTQERLRAMEAEEEVCVCLCRR